MLNSGTEAEKRTIKHRRPDLYKLLLKVGARFVGLKSVNLNDIKIDQGIYPREETDWDKVEMYAEAMKNGDEFPPILVASEPENLLVDGNHRFNATKRFGAESCWAEEWDIPKPYVKLIAQSANTEMGNIDTPLSGKEKKRAILQDWQDGIRDLELIASALKTSIGYIKNVLSKAGLLRSKKEKKDKMKERAKELRDEGLPYREVSKKLEDEFGEKVNHQTVKNWMDECLSYHQSDELDTPKETDEGGAKFTQVKNAPSHPNTEYSEPTEPEPDTEPTEKEEYARYKDTDIPLATIEYWVGECRSYVETGTPPEEAVEIVKVHPDVKKYVIDELRDRYWKESKAKEPKEEAKEETEQGSREDEIQKWVNECKPYVDAKFTPKEAVEQAGVPEELRVPVVKKLVGYKNHLFQEDIAKEKAELGPVKWRRREILREISSIALSIRYIENLLNEIDNLLPKTGDQFDQEQYQRYGRDQYTRDYLTFMLVRGGWEQADWFREITRRYVRYTLHPSYAKEFIEDMKEQAKLTPEEWAKQSKEFWEQYLASDADIEWKKFCESHGLPLPPEYQFGEGKDD